MRLRMHSTSAVSRPVMLLFAEVGIDYEPMLIELFEGKQFEASCAALNPCCMAPTLEDEGF